MKNISKTWKENINLESNKCAKLKYNVPIHGYVQWLLKAVEAVGTYDRLIPVDETNIPIKWLQEANDIAIEERKRYNKNLK